MNMPQNTKYTQSAVPWWEPSLYGENFLKDYKLRDIEEFPFVQRFWQTIYFMGDEVLKVRPVMYGPYINVPEFKQDYHNPYTRIKQAWGGLWMDAEQTCFALHTEWWFERAVHVKMGVVQEWKTHPIDHWVELTYFKRDPESDIWLALSPTEDELEILKLWAIVAELAQ